MSSSRNTLLLALTILTLIPTTIPIHLADLAYQDIVIDLRQALPVDNCTEILYDLETAFTSASYHLYIALGGRAYFGKIIINLPSTWPDNCVPDNHTIHRSSGESSDFTITLPNRLFGDRPWAKQSGGCYKPGMQVYIGYRGLKTSNIGKDLVREFAKYRYGIFDELGYKADNVYPICHFTESQHLTGCSDGKTKEAGLCAKGSPYFDITKHLDKRSRASIMFAPQAEHVTMFCDSTNHDRWAPTKHNLLCGRRSTLDVILEHDDFRHKNLMSYDTTADIIINTIPIFEYRRRYLTRYAVVIDDTQDSLLRESWSFLRSAIRKWVLYDLLPNTEVGVVLANDTRTSKIFDITPLNIQKNRDLVASFIPYTPSDSRQLACISCAIIAGIDLLIERRRVNGTASDIVLIIAPGMDYGVNYEELINVANKENVRMVTINYPGVIRRQSLDVLAKNTRGLSFTINEKKYNSEKSFLNTYFELNMILFHISGSFYEGPKSDFPIEIHRKELVDIINDGNSTRRISRVINGGFYMDDSVRLPSGFYIYTHNVEQPLIQNVKLISPNGVQYGTRSDQRMPVKQLTLIAIINITGSWTYMIDRINGNPQPHFVQVFATPTGEEATVIRANAWYDIPKGGGPKIFYCELLRGDYPVHAASVQVIVTRIDIQTCNYTTNCQEKFYLLDTGSGDPDITKGDGIYSRYFSAKNLGPGIYKFEVYVNDNGNTAHSLQDNSQILNLPCCGSTFENEQTRQTAPFQRFLPPITIVITEEDLLDELRLDAGRIGDLTSEYIAPGRIRLRWTSPDMGGYSVTKYELKYAFHIQDIIENFDINSIPWEHDIPRPLSIGDVTTFMLDVISYEPDLVGKPIFFGLRPYTKISTNDDIFPGPVSNPVRAYVPNSSLTTQSPKEESPNPFLGILLDDDLDDNSNKTNGTALNDSNSIIKSQYAIPIIAGLICALCVILMYCIFCVIKRQKNRHHAEAAAAAAAAAAASAAQNNNDDNNTTGISEPDHDHKSDIHSNCDDNQQQQQHQQHQQYPSSSSQRNSVQSSPVHDQINNYTIAQNYSTIEDHHTLGIPVLNNDNDDELKIPTPIPNRFDIIHQQHKDYHHHHQDMLPQHRNHFDCSGNVAVISTYDDLSPFESWTASKLLTDTNSYNNSNIIIEKINDHNTNNTNTTTSDHYRKTQMLPDQISVSGISCGLHHSDRTSISDRSGIAPPVPPLPTNTIQQQQQGYTNQLHMNVVSPHIHMQQQSINNSQLYGINTLPTNLHHHQHQHQQQQQPPPPLRSTSPHQQQQQQQPPTYSTISRTNPHLIGHNPFVQGAVNTVSTSDRRRRNVTMV